MSKRTCLAIFIFHFSNEKWNEIKGKMCIYIRKMEKKKLTVFVVIQPFLNCLFYLGCPNGDTVIIGFVS